MFNDEQEEDLASWYPRRCQPTTTTTTLIDGLVQLGSSPPSSSSRGNNIHCVNCGERGHVFRECSGPITSFGIIAFRSYEDQPVLGAIIEDPHRVCRVHGPIDLPDQIPRPHDPVYLLVQRKDTMGYIDFVRGKYQEDAVEDPKQLMETYLSEMTCDERYRIANWSFEEIWDKLWINHNSRCYRNEYKHAKNKFAKTNVKEILSRIPCKWSHQEFGFPKGRRSLQESNLQCAVREFCEETGYLPHHLELIFDELPLCEIFVGTNHKQYKHVYYLARVKTEAGPPRMCYENLHQAGEIRNVGWFSYDQCRSRIRPYDTTKIDILNDAHGRIGRLMSTVNRRLQ
jgi:8-oxo-dGTP pyrophosphatase MutT (NUDIX family)